MKPVTTKKVADKSGALGNLFGAAAPVKKAAAAKSDKIVIDVKGNHFGKIFKSKN